ncbi:MAG: hypothetical protein ACMUIP_15460 [bacterium]
MKSIRIIVLICFMIALTVFYAHPILFAEDIGTIYNPPSFSSQPLLVPAQSTTSGDILIDNFEYWDSPYNHGWMQEIPAYPTFGFGIGYSVNFETLLDYKEGSRVLNAYRPSSEFLLSTPYEKYFVTKYLSETSSIALYPGAPDKAAVLSFKYWAPLGIESWDMFELQVHGSTLGEDGIAGTDDDKLFIIQIMPLETPYTRDTNKGISTDNMGDNHAALIQEGSPTSPMIIKVDIGRNFNSGTWHTVWLDLNNLNQKAHNGAIPPAWELGKATVIRAGGSQFRLDDIVFRTKDYANILPPDLMEIGPRYAQLYEPLRFLFMAEYETEGEIARMSDLLLDSDNFILDKDIIRHAWIEDSRVNGIIQIDPTYLDPNHHNYGNPEPFYSQLLGRDIIIDITLPLFADPALRIGGTKAASLRTQVLGWKASVGGYGDKGSEMINLNSLPINPYDGMPTYIMLYYYSGFKAIHSEKRFSSPSAGLAHYGPLECSILESAMWNAGFTVWPNIAYMDFTPQVLENFIVTIEVTNGLARDIETFPISVVNYPMENYPPVPQRLICAKLFYPWEENECIILFADPDCYIFSLSHLLGRTPGTNHLPNLFDNAIRDDQDQLIHRMTINGLPSYQYGPWAETIIDQRSGLTSLVPKFENTLHTVVTCQDNRGAIAVGERPIFVVNKGTWLNHPPLAVGTPKKPQITRAGEEFFLSAPYITVIDPDQEPIYASCNIGALGKTADGTFIWTLQTNFPGVYDIELTFYDAQGGLAVIEFPLDVIPWWSDN